MPPWLWGAWPALRRHAPARPPFGRIPSATPRLRLGQLERSTLLLVVADLAVALLFDGAFLLVALAMRVERGLPRAAQVALAAASAAAAAAALLAAAAAIGFGGAPRARRCRASRTHGRPRHRVVGRQGAKAHATVQVQAQAYEAVEDAEGMFPYWQRLTSAGNQLEGQSSTQHEAQGMAGTTPERHCLLAGKQFEDELCGLQGRFFYADKQAARGRRLSSTGARPATGPGGAKGSPAMSWPFPGPRAGGW